MRALGRIVSIAVAIAVVMLALGGVMPASAQSALTAQAVPTSGPAGGSFAVQWTLYLARGCDTITVTWPYGTYTATPPPAPRRTPASGSVAVSVPRTAEQGTHSISVYCAQAKTGTRFTVKGIVPTTTNPPTTTTTRPPVTTTRPPVTTTRRPPVITTTTPPTTTTTTPPVTTTTTTTTTTTPPTTTPTTTIPSDGDLALDRDAIQPGEGLQATGTGCLPDAPVVLSSGGQLVGATTADAQGGFTADIAFTKVEPGRHLITAECGIVLTGAVDQLVTSSTGGGQTALVVLVFFVLAGVALIRFA